MNTKIITTLILLFIYSAISAQEERPLSGIIIGLNGSLQKRNDSAFSGAEFNGLLGVGINLQYHWLNKNNIPLAISLKASSSKGELVHYTTNEERREYSPRSQSAEFGCHVKLLNSSSAGLNGSHLQVGLSTSIVERTLATRRVVGQGHGFFGSYPIYGYKIETKQLVELGLPISYIYHSSSTNLGWFVSATITPTVSSGLIAEVAFGTSIITKNKKL